MTLVPMNRQHDKENLRNRPSGQPGRAFSWEPWKLQGACHGHPTVKLETEDGRMVDHVLTIEDFYVEIGRGRTNKSRKLHFDMLRRVCGRCPVLDECRELAAVEDWGFLAGLTETERQKRKKGRLISRG